MGSLLTRFAEHHAPAIAVEQYPAGQLHAPGQYQTAHEGRLCRLWPGVDAVQGEKDTEQAENEKDQTEDGEAMQIERGHGVNR